MTQTDDTARCGNTNNATCHSNRSRAWFITDFQCLSPQHVDKSTYECWCLDTTKPEKGSKVHLHHVLYFKNAISFNTVKKLYPTGHIEKPRNIYECIGYVLNNVNGRKYDIHEQGVKPVDTRFASVKDLKECKTPDELDWKQYNTWKKIHDNDEIDIDDFHKDVKVYYIQGPSGVGKTQKAIEIIRENGYKKFSNAKYENGFWCNVGSNRDVLLYDDFRDSHMKASEFINLIDYNKHSMNLKGSSCTNDYKLIIITSVQYITEIYKSCYGEPRKQWMRRVEVINLRETVCEDTTELNDEIDIDAL